ncbi:MAG: hypothetical protein V2I33_24670 [Kangiellaceae bacterium]|nr:hypothetical protein [Kangiellaceae bacterium]
MLLYDWTMPMPKEQWTRPGAKHVILKIVLAFSIITLYGFLYTRYIVFTISRVSCYMDIKEQLIGLTIICWGNNIGDMVNSAVAAKHGLATLAIASAMTTQIFNILFSVGFPWLLS